VIEPLNGKIAWVTGGGSGIGQASAVELAEVGATVVVWGGAPDALSETAALTSRPAGKGKPRRSTPPTNRRSSGWAAILARHAASTSSSTARAQTSRNASSRISRRADWTASSAST